MLVLLHRVQVSDVRVEGAVDGHVVRGEVREVALADEVPGVNLVSERSAWVKRTCPYVAKPAAFILWEIKSISSGKKFEHTGGCCPVMCTGKRPESSERRVGLQ